MNEKNNKCILALKSQYKKNSKLHPYKFNILHALKS